jgi:hypothetical protein
MINLKNNSVLDSLRCSHFIFLSLGLLATFIVPTVVCADVILLDDNFNYENKGRAALNYSGFENWIVTRGTVDLIGNGSYDFYPGNGLYVDLDGSSRLGGKLESEKSFVLDPGTYELRFDIANNNSATQDRNTMTVTLGDIYRERFTRSGKSPFQTIVQTINIVTPTRGRLVFDQSGGDNDGIIIDNIQLTYLTKSPNSQ